MKKVSVFLAVLALVTVLTPSGSEARPWEICRTTMSRAWKACNGDTSATECCSAVSDASEECPENLSWRWLGRATAQCEANNTPMIAQPPPEPTRPSPRMSCKVIEVMTDCMKEINEINWDVTTTIGAGCCQKIIHLIDECQNDYDFTVQDYWKKSHAYCVTHQN